MLSYCSTLSVLLQISPDFSSSFFCVDFSVIAHEGFGFSIRTYRKEILSRISSLYGQLYKIILKLKS